MFHWQMNLIPTSHQSRQLVTFACMHPATKISVADPHSQAILRNVARSIALTIQEQEYFISLLQRRGYAKNEPVLAVGDSCMYQNFVVEGCLKVYYLDETGEEHIAKFAIENWWAFDI